MTEQHILAEMRRAFSKRWQPSTGAYDRVEFETDLDRLIYKAFAVAEEPFARELKLYRDDAVKSAMLKP